MLSTTLAQSRRDDSLRETYNSFISRIKDLPVNFRTTAQLDLSSIRADNAFSDFLHAEISKHSHSICEAQITIHIDAQTNEELVYIVDYIRKLRLSVKTMIIESTQWNTDIDRLVFFISLIKDERSISLKGPCFKDITDDILEKLSAAFKNSACEHLSLSEAELNVAPQGTLKKFISLLKETTIPFIHIYTQYNFKHRTIEGLDYQTFIKKWCEEAPLDTQPLLDFSFLSQESIKTLSEQLEKEIFLKLAKMHYGSRLLHGYYPVIIAGQQEFTIDSLSTQENFEILQFLIELDEKHRKAPRQFMRNLINISKALALDPKDKHQWIKNLIDSDVFLSSFYFKELEISTLPKEDQLDIFLYFYPKELDYFHNVVDFIPSFESFKHEPGYRLLSAFEIMDESFDDDEPESAVSILIEQNVPLLKEQAQTYLGADLSFVPACITSIEAQHRNHMGDSSYALLRMIAWLRWSCAKIDFIGPRLDSKLIRDTFNHVMKQIFDFAHPSSRYALTDLFLERLCTDKQGLYFKLTEGLAFNALLPAIPLTMIILEETDKKLQSNHEKLVKSFLSLLASKQFYGRFQRTMVAGLMSIAKDRVLSPSQKLSIIQAIASNPLLEHIIEISKKPKTPENDIAIDKLVSDLEKHDPDLSKNLELSLWGFGTDQKKEGSPNKNQRKLSSLLKKEGARQTRDLESIEKALAPLKDIIQNNYITKHFKRIISRFIMVQGLAGIGQLSALVDLEDIPSSSISPTDSSIEKFDLQARTVFQEMFQIKHEQFEYYQATFAERHNEAALLTYYAKLYTLKDPDDDKLIAVFQSFVQGVLSPGSAEFYRTRYDQTKNPHLAAILKGREDLAKRWIPESGPTHFSTELRAFIVNHDIKHRDYEPNFRVFIEEKIFRHKHLDPQYYQNLKQYLEAADGSQQAAIRQSIEAEAVEDTEASTNDTIDHEAIQKRYRAKLTLALLALLEIPVDKTIPMAKRYDAHISVTQKSYQLLSKTGCNSYDFQEDLKTLMQGLKNNKKPIQPMNDALFPGYRLVVTDNYWQMFMCGTDVEGSCQSVDGTADLNKCLMGYVMNGHVKMVAILNAEGIIVGRCMIKLLAHQASREPVLFLESIYPETIRADFREALIQYAIQYAKRINLPLATVKSLPFGYENTQTIDRIEDDKLGNTSSDQDLLVCTGGLAVYEYSDASHLQPNSNAYTIEKDIRWIDGDSPSQVLGSDFESEQEEEPAPTTDLDAVSSQEGAPLAPERAVLTFAYTSIPETPPPTAPSERPEEEAYLKMHL